MRMFSLFCVLMISSGCLCDKQIGPDPWNYDNDLPNKINSDLNVPPDLKLVAKKKIEHSSGVGIGEWFFRSTLGMILKGGQVKHNQDDSVEISLQLRLNPEKWATLDKYLMSETPFTEEMYRKSIGYVQNAIYKPTITEKIVLAWGEYIQFCLTEYKVYIMWSLAAAAGVLSVIWLWKYVSVRHLIILAFIVTYIYEAFTSYKEAEQQEVKRFLDAVDSCKWRFWSSTYCDVPQPDPLIFLKYMNPSKIAIRMFTNLISEPMITINEVVKVIIHSVTDGLWFPFNTIVNGVLLLTFNVVIIMLLIMIVYNYIFNIPFSLNFLPFGFLSVNVKQRNRNFMKDNHQDVRKQLRDDRISDNTLNKLLDVFNQALDNKHKVQSSIEMHNVTKDKSSKLKRSLSAGRLLDYRLTSTLALKEKKRNVDVRKEIIGDGDGDHI